MANHFVRPIRATVVILLVAGHCLGLQPGLEYVYRYNANLASGLSPNIKRHYAIVAFRADVTVQVAEDYSLLMQFMKVETDDQHDVLECDPMLPLNITYHPIREGSDFIHKPFRVIANTDKMAEILEVSTDEPVWVSNIKKAFVDIFPFGTFLREAESSERSVFMRPTFEAYDELVTGNCVNRYSVVKVPEAYAAEKEAELGTIIEEDVQRQVSSSASYTAEGSSAKSARGRKGSKTSTKTSPARLTEGVAPITDTLWQVTRTTDFDRCKGQSEIFKMNAPENMKEIISRSSSTHFLVRGDKLGMRIEEAIVRGSVSVSTSNKQKETIDTLTHQRVYLKAVKTITETLTTDFEPKEVTRCFFETDDHLKQDGTRPSLEEILTGHRLKPGDVTRIKEFISSKVQEISRNQKHSVSAMRKLADAVGYLSGEDISELYQNIVDSRHSSPAQDKVNELQLDIFKVACLTSGSENALKFVLNRDNFIGPEKEFSVLFFHNAQLTIKDPNLLPKVLELTKSLRWGMFSTFQKSLAITSTASLFHELCFSEEARKCSNGGCKPERRCRENEMLDAFLSFVGEEIRDATTAQKVVYLQAVTNLRTPQALKFLLPYVLGTAEEDVGLRRLAIMSLSSDLMPSTAKPLVQKVLTSLVENLEEHVGVRSMAFLVMTSWNPGGAWWTRMAVSTWQDPSTQMAELISSVIKHIADSDREVAPLVSKVAPLAKPAVTTITRFYENYVRKHVDENVPKYSSLLWFAVEQNMIPSYISLMLSLPSLRGFSSSLKMSLEQKELFYILHKFNFLVPTVFDYMVDENHLLVEDMIAQRIEELGIKMTGFPSDFRLKLTFDDKLLFNYADDTPNFFYDSEVGDTVMRLIPGFYEFPYHYKTVDSSVVFPTDLGIPLIVRHLDETGVRKEHEVMIDPPEFSSLYMNLGLDIRVGISHASSVDMTTLAPWSNSFGVRSGISNELNLNLPLKFHFGRARRSQFVLDLQFSGEKEEIVHSLNYPYTVHRGGFPLHLAEQSDPRIGQPIPRVILPNSGFKLESLWNPIETKEPSWLEKLSGNDEFHPLLPMHNSWEYHLTFDGSHSPDKKIRLIFTTASVDAPESQDFVSGQGTKGDANYAEFSQISQSSSVDYSQLSQSRGGFPDGEYMDYFTEEDGVGFNEAYERATRLHERLDIYPGKHRVISVSAEVKDSRPATYRASVLMSGGESSRQPNLYLHHLAAEFDSVNGALAQPICFKAKVESPSFPKFTPREEIITSDLSAQIHSQIRKDKTCKAEPTWEVKGTLQPNAEPVQGKDSYSLTMKSAQFNIAMLPEVIPIWTTITSSDLFTMITKETRLLNVSNSQTTNSSHHVETFGIQRVNDFKDSLFDSALPFLYSGLPSISSTCRVGKTKIITFDEKEIPFDPDNCWITAVVDNIEKWLIILIRYVGHWEVQILDASLGLQFDVSRTQVTVNGKEPSAKQGYYKVRHLEGAILLTLFSRVVIKVSEIVQISVPLDLQEGMAGLCGNFNSQRFSHMVGPQGCVFNDPHLFADSWTYPGDGCNAFTHKAKMQKVESYRENCPRLYYRPTGDTANANCTTWEYRVLEDENFRCTAVMPTPKCGSGCHCSEEKEKRIVYRCEKTEGRTVAPAAPAHPRNIHRCKTTQDSRQSADMCFERTFATTYPTNCVPSID